MRASLPWLVLVLMLPGCSSAMSPLHEAALTGNTEAVRSAVASKRNLDPLWDEPTRGIEGNYARLIGLTPLMLAARGGHLEVTKLLVEGGANLYAQANTQLRGEPLTSFDFAVQSGHVAVADYLWRKSDGARLGARLSQHIADACSASCREGAGTDTGSNMALFLLGIAPEVAAGNGVGQAACSSPKPIDMLAFVEKYAPRPPRNTLHCMAFGTYSRHRPVEERKAVVTWMIDHGAAVNGRLFDWTPLIGAASARDRAMVELLLERGADANLLASGLTPIGAAANTCMGVAPSGAEHPELQAELETVELLARVSDPAVYRSPQARASLTLLNKCCARVPQVDKQRRICAVFGF